jgi:anti-anti-sigma regulatory factor
MIERLIMRIQVDELDDSVKFQVEGRLAGAWVPELEQCWQSAVIDHPERKISVDLSGVTCVDQAGQYLLRLMSKDGVSITGAGLAIRETLEQTAGHARRGD